MNYDKAISKTRTQQLGLTLIEVLGALAIGAGLMTFMIQLIGNLSQNQYAVFIQRHHQVLADASAQYIENNWTALSESLATSADSELRIPMSELANKGALFTWWPNTNPMGQSSCLLVRRQPPIEANGEAVLYAMLVTEGGADIKLENIWTAAGVSGHGIGILDQPYLPDSKRGPVQARGLYGQWEASFDNTGQGQAYLGLGCNNTALTAGHLATWLTVRNPREIGALQVVKRRNATTSEQTTMVGSLSLPKPASGTAVIDINMGQVKDADSACIESEDGATAATRKGQVLVCSLGLDNARKWRALSAATAVQRLSAPQFAVLKTVVPATSCSDSVIGELAKVADGALAYCSRKAISDAATTWTWRKVGGKWKYVLAFESSYFSSIGNPISFPSLPTTARATQMQIFMEPTDNILTVYAKYGNAIEIPIARTCCYRSSNIAYMSGPPGDTILRVNSAIDNGISALWVNMTGYIDDDSN